MGYKKSQFGLFYSLPLDPTDWENLTLSGVKRVMLPFRIAVQYQHMVATLAERKVSLVLRLDERELQSYPPAQYRTEAASIKSVIKVDAILLGNEPESGVDLTYASSDWAVTRAEHHAYRVNALRTALTGLGIALVSPGWTAGRLHEVDRLQPGRQSWRIACGESYSYCHGSGGHVYLHEWRSWADEFRFLYQVSELCEMFHRPVWLDEVGVTDGTDLEQMAAYIRMSGMLEDARWPAHDRVEAFIPFVGNGDPYKRDEHGNIILKPDGTPDTHWNPKYLLRDRAAYELLGSYMRKAA